MANIILTPVTLWKDFDDTLPFDEEIVSEREEKGIVTREVYFSGRACQSGRVRIFARYVFPSGVESFPAVMVLFEAGLAFDGGFVHRLVKNGYGVLCVDYSGEREGEKYTVYPPEIGYANYARAGGHMDFAEPTARETSWYEWAGVARYAVRYLHERKEVTCVGAIGLRTGGEVLFKVAPYAGLGCMVSVCAAGWLAYRGKERFGESTSSEFDDERHRFIAGLDSQSYAPYLKCPVLLLSAVNDRKYNYERVYDTYVQINPEVEKAILFSAHGNGLIGTHSFDDVDLFLDKYLKGHSVFISGEIDLTVCEDEEGNLVTKSKFDENGEIQAFGIFYTEKITGRTRDWTRILGKQTEDGVGVVPLPLYKGSKRAIVYSFVSYSNGFSVTSKIVEVEVKKTYKNMRERSRVVYTNSDELNGFSTYYVRERSMADCFVLDKARGIRLETGYGGIEGITSDLGMVTYRVSEPRCEPHAGASFRFDAWSEKGGKLRIVFYKETEERTYSCDVRVEGGGKWKSIFLDSEAFKCETGASLNGFEGVSSAVFFCEGILVNNILWL